MFGGLLCVRVSFYFFGGRRVSFNLSAVFGGASVVDPIPLFGFSDVCLRVCYVCV